ncbi:MAG: 4Fe-4S binding protein [Clostridiales Family XIII bacterium]|jgi:2-oxoglutarate ferredoxin oxidoreductase subunit delta|nr:4Fe-4S binding protein [Clostridiales Family XIII bacterium]
MAELHLNIEKCKSCGYCVFSCPQGALELSESMNRDGYNYAFADDAKCTKCGICYTVCPDGVFQITAD